MAIALLFRQKIRILKDTIFARHERKDKQSLKTLL